MRILAYISCVLIGVLVGGALGVFTGFKAEEIIHGWAPPDIQLSSKEIIRNMEGNGLAVPPDAYDLEYLYQSSPTDWSKMIGFSANEPALIKTIQTFIEKNPVKNTYESEKKEYFSWPTGPDWWPRGFENATVYTGENYSLAHDKKNNRLFLLFYTL